MPGKIITFYSYKGGTGRSMLLANVAWILAARGKRVLTVDWDLEAPGLHRYLHPFLKDKDLTSSPGVIDFVIDFGVEAMTPDRKDVSEDWYLPYANVLRYATALDWNFPDGGALHFISAGKQGPLYASRVNSFNWQNFYDRLGGGPFLDAVRARMAAEYDFILIDSRTGVSDTSGICTVQMPDILVVCFSMNNQSIEGAGAVAASVYAQRRKHGALLLPYIFPVPTRIDIGEKDKLDLAREYAQSKFGPFIEHISDQPRYWGDVEILHFPFYSYEEVLATFGDKPGPANSLLAAADRITCYLTPGEPIPWAAPSDADRQRILLQYARQSSSTRDLAAKRVEAAEREFLRLTPGDQKAAHRIFLRLITLAPENEGGGATRWKWPLDDLGPSTDREMVDQLNQAGLISVERDQNSHKEFITMANDTILERWPRMREWLREDRDFLLWRQDLRGAIGRWERLKRSDDGLLEGSLLKEATKYLSGHQDYLSVSELQYIAASIALRERLAQEGGAAPRQASSNEKLASTRGSSRLLRSLVVIAAFAVIVAGLVYLRHPPPPIPVSNENQHPTPDPSGSPSPRPIPEPVVKPLLGHSDIVLSLAFSPDGRTLASGSFDKTVRLWNPETGSLMGMLKNNHFVYSVAFSPDGNTLATGGDETVVKLWDVQTRVLKRTLAGAKDGGVAVAFSPDGRLLACGGSNNGAVKIWDVQAGQLKYTLAGHHSIVYSLAFSPDGKTLATGSYDGTAGLWNAQTWSLKLKVNVGKGHVQSVALSPDGATLVTAFEGSATEWDAQTGEQRKALKGSGYCEAVAFSPDGAFLATGNDPSTLVLWDTLTWTQKLKLEAQGSMQGISSIVFSPDNKMVAYSGGQSRAVSLYVLNH